VQGNLIGTDASGSVALGNSNHGVWIYNTDDNTIGGTVDGAGNVISGNGGNGLDITSGSGNVAQGNLIGTDASGSVALGNTGHGAWIFITSATNNTIGGAVDGAGNVISGNGGNGVSIYGAPGNVVEGNLIGTDAGGSAAVGNTGHGVSISEAPGHMAADNTVGGTADGERNIIAHNGESGVDVRGTTTTGNTISGNSIHTNGAKGIRNWEGGNTELEPPIIDSVGSASGHTDPKCYPCTVEVFSDDEDEGRIYHGSTTTNDDATGTWTYGGAVTGPNITATVTDADRNTSEFSAPLACTDTDGDGFDDCVEGFVSTLPLVACPATAIPDDEDPDAWPPDWDDTQTVNLLDLLPFKQHSRATDPSDPKYDARFDLNTDGAINILDLLPFKPFFRLSCT
jgi:hypothetical protein